MYSHICIPFSSISVTKVQTSCHTIPSSLCLAKAVQVFQVIMNTVVNSLFIANLQQKLLVDFFLSGNRVSPRTSFLFDL